MPGHTPHRRGGGGPDDREQLLLWRRRALEQQLPAATFPAGSGAPSLIYLWASMFVVVAVVLGFALNAQRGVLPAVIDSQRDVVTKLASTISVANRAWSDELDRAVAGRGTVTDAELLTRLVGDGTSVSGAAVVETASRRSLASKGTAVPADLIPAEIPLDSAFGATMPDGPVVLRAYRLDETRTLVALRPLTLRNLRLNPDAGHGVHVLTRDGGTSLMQGANAVGQEHLPVVFEGLAGSTSRQSREVVIEEWPDRRLIVSSAPVGDTGLVVVSLLAAEVTGGASLRTGLLLGLTLLMFAVPSFLLMRMSLVRPIRVLLAQAKADACGGLTPHRRPARIAEAHRIARALALTSGDRPPAARRWRPTVLQGLTVAMVVALLWPAGAVVLALQNPAPTVPTQLVRDQENRAEEAAVALGSALDAGLGTVSRTSRSVDPDDRERTAGALRRELAEAGRLRALYLVDRDGKVMVSAGREPLRTAEPLPGEVGVHLDEAVSRLPVVFAYNLRSDGFAVVGEFDPDRLVGLVRRVDGRVRVVDAELRTILDSEGYRAYQPLGEDLAASAAIEALPGNTVGRSATADGAPALVAASGLTAPTTVAHLEWSVVVEQDIAALRLPEMVERRWTLLVAAAMVGIILLTHMWQLYIYVRPVQRLASFANRMSRGEIDVPVPPQRHDDIGAVAMCLEICRQVRHTGSARFGGAIRMRGSELNRTTVLPRVRRPEPARGKKG
ncbi:HAMP domain-containing protein [Micromonospora echinospora]|uniref:histidine kinase n=1 Tax=Micromonospora echinospora TaxID=1877 RepID=A0A1C4W0J5_MICEC|nr:HAMP domain-containing protein [Micromonospora echinospora]OZV80157.1 HAMP domain-containing protein [Micromonospora echinospora]SCE89688.1 hypothetical protein GA0070618_1752 [Micromonospora echinospora]